LLELKLLFGNTDVAEYRYNPFGPSSPFAKALNGPFTTALEKYGSDAAYCPDGLNSDTTYVVLALIEMASQKSLAAILKQFRR
jgi:hypothetical protein